MVFLCSCGGLIWENRIHVCGSFRCSCGGIKFDGRIHCCGYKPDYSIPPTDYEVWKGFRAYDGWMGSVNWGKQGPNLFTTKNQEISPFNSVTAMEEIKNIEQAGYFQDYCVSFDILLTKVILSEDYATNLFIKGLKSEIKSWVQFVSPKSLMEAYEFARNQNNLLAYCGHKGFKKVEIEVFSVNVHEKGSEIKIQPIDESDNRDEIQETCDNIIHEMIVVEVVDSDILKENGGTNKNALKVFAEMLERCSGDDLKKMEKTCDNEGAPKRFDEMPKEVGSEIKDILYEDSRKGGKEIDASVDEIHEACSFDNNLDSINPFDESETTVATHDKLSKEFSHHKSNTNSATMDNFYGEELDVISHILEDKAAHPFDLAEQPLKIKLWEIEVVDSAYQWLLSREFFTMEKLILKKKTMVHWWHRWKSKLLFWLVIMNGYYYSKLLFITIIMNGCRSNTKTMVYLWHRWKSEPLFLILSINGTKDHKQATHKKLDSDKGSLVTKWNFEKDKTNITVRNFAIASYSDPILLQGLFIE